MSDEGARSVGTVVAVARHAVHAFSKPCVARIELVAGHGVEGDAHAGVTVKHRSRVRQDPTQPNLRQIHLIHAELIDELQAAGFRVFPGAMGENVTTRGLDLLSLPVDACLCFDGGARVRLTGLRNPCKQLDGYQQGLTAAVLDRDPEGRLVRKAGVMGVVVVGGPVMPGSRIRVELPPAPHRRLERV
jgi:MOSC domain-containing protein YiiM